MWLNKSKVTDEAMSAVAQYLLEHEESMTFTYQGEGYILQVVKDKGEVASSTKSDPAPTTGE